MRPTPPSNADLAAVSVKRPLFAAVLNLLIIIGGLAAMMGIEVRELPDVDRPIVSVNATFPGAAPETIDAEVTRILEDAAARVAGVREVNSSSEENGGRLRIEFNPGIDLDVAANDVRESIASVQRELPERVEQLSIRKADSEGDPVLVIAAQSKTYALEDFTRIVENDIVPELLAVDGVAAIEQFGTRKREMRVVIDPLRLTRFGLTVTDVAAALQGAPFDVPVGSFRSADQQLLIRAEATAATPSMIEAVIITGETRVGDVAQAYFGPADAENYVKLNGEHVIGLGVIRQAQSNTIEISEAVGEKLVQLNARLPEIDLVVTSDNADFIRLSVREVLISLSLTILIVVSTIYLFFGAVRATLIPTLTIPVALIGVIAGIWLLGFSVNLLTLLALVLATGLIVDDAIVVLENIQRLQGQGFRRKASAVLGTRQVFFAVIATTAVLASVFVPISFLPSTAGRLFREFGFVLALAVIISSFVALTLVPAAAAQLRLTAEYQRFTSFASLGKRFGAYYATMLDFVLRAPFLVIAVATAVALGAGFTYTNLKSELVPNEDRGEIVIFANGPDGVGVDFMERQADQIEAILEPLIESGEVTGHFNVIGRWDPNRIWLTATLAPWGERDRSHQDIINSIRAQLSAIPGARIFAFSRNSLNIRGTDNGGVSFAITGNEYAAMYDVALEITQQMEALGGLFDNIEIDYQPTQPQVSIQIDRRRASDLGVPLDDLALTLRAMVGGVDLIDLNVDDQAIPIILEAETQAINSPSDLQNLYVRAAGDRLIPLSAITKLVEEGVSAELDRVEQRRAIEIQATLDPSISLAEAVDLLKGLTDDILPTQMGLVLMGQAATLEETTNELAITYAFALIIVFLVLVAQFESFSSALVIVLTVPFALAAAIYALLISGVSLNIYSQIGLVMLIGLMAKNGILLVEFADQLRGEGRSVREAVEEAAKVRLRPIMMTLLSTVIGALPLVLASGAGAEARVSIGWVIFGGLGLAGIFTLFLTPVSYLCVARFSRPRADISSEVDRQLAEEPAE
ncbi:MAG: efflux RND transporter permease subunit [Sphingomonadales bacterium]